MPPATEHSDTHVAAPVFSHQYHLFENTIHDVLIHCEAQDGQPHAAASLVIHETTLQLGVPNNSYISAPPKQQ